MEQRQKMTETKTTLLSKVKASRAARVLNPTFSAPFVSQIRMARTLPPKFFSFDSLDMFCFLPFVLTQTRRVRSVLAV